MRADRLMQILIILQRQHKATSKELALQLEVSERTIHRDMEALSAAGIPVLADRGTGGGWYLHEGYRHLMTGMNRKDIETLLVPELTARGEGSTWADSFQKASSKLLAALPGDWRKQAEEVRRRIHVDGAGWHAKSPGENESILSLLQEAVWAGKKILITYNTQGRSSDRNNGKESPGHSRLISPYGLVIKGVIWYVVARQDKAEESDVTATISELKNASIPVEHDGTGIAELRTYRVSRIAAASMTEELQAPPPANFDLAAYWAASLARFKQQLPEYPALVAATDDGLDMLRAARFVEVEELDRISPDYIQARLKFNTLESAAGIIMGMSGNVQVLEPEELRQQIAEMARRLWEDHKKR